MKVSGYLPIGGVIGYDLANSAALNQWYKALL